MRLRPFVYFALLLAACNSILGNTDHRLKLASGGSDGKQASCRLNTDCAQAEVCIFQTCGPPCNGDQDCDQGLRCLMTNAGTACVPSSAAKCDATCPPGTTCSRIDGACRNSCDTTECLAGQTCSNGLCISAESHELGSGGGGAGGGNGGSGGAGHPVVAGAAGRPTSDACVGKVCNTPPPSSCASPTKLTTYDQVGSCSNGICDYTAHSIACTCQSDACTTDPCLSVACTSPPEAKCKSMTTKTTYAATGSCTAGSCSYAATDTECARSQCGGNGVCAPCTSDSSCGASCTACTGQAPKCKDMGAASKCVRCVSSDQCPWPTGTCNLQTNVCETQPSCKDLAKTCGPSGNADCCASTVVTGGTFNRGNTVSYPATVANFRLDTYEITVGRFRKFVAAYSKTMIPSGAGKNPSNPSDTGWDSAWNTNLAEDSPSLAVQLSCLPSRESWSDTVLSAAVESLPINCLHWFHAAAFCIWDGGRLPSEAEWNYASVGGSEQRAYPWGTSQPDCTFANYMKSVGVNCTDNGVSRVGALSPIGDGRYGQADLGGNVAEWVQDWYRFAYPVPCDNCAFDGPSPSRSLLGGSYETQANGLSGSTRGGAEPGARRAFTGARCARSP